MLLMEWKTEQTLIRLLLGSSLIGVFAVCKVTSVQILTGHFGNKTFLAFLGSAAIKCCEVNLVLSPVELMQ